MTSPAILTPSPLEATQESVVLNPENGVKTRKKSLARNTISAVAWAALTVLAGGNAYADSKQLTPEEEAQLMALLATPSPELITAQNRAEEAKTRLIKVSIEAEEAKKCNDAAIKAGELSARALDMTYVLDNQDRFQATADTIESCQKVFGGGGTATYTGLRRSVAIALKWAGQPENVALNTGNSSRGHAQKVSTTAANWATGVKNPDQKVEN